MLESSPNIGAALLLEIINLKFRFLTLQLMLPVDVSFPLYAVNLILLDFRSSFCLNSLYPASGVAFLPSLFCR